MKNVIVISSSPHKDGNSELLAKSFLQGAAEAGNKAELKAGALLYEGPGGYISDVHCLGQ